MANSAPSTEGVTTPPRSAENALIVHVAADALVDYAVATFWRTDSGFASSSRHSYEAAAAWLHQHASGVEPDANPDDLVHLFGPSADSLAACGETDVIQTAVLIDSVTCGWCRVDAHVSSPAQTTSTERPERGEA